ncbi:MAG: glucose-6-phosphate dehydrogenase, partial [Rhodobacteraceae bacterium]|nr:glucose-6-phosphate dehydrogenase [Paracoccaceae bacterium]
MVSRTIPVDTFDLVIFGATGDLARRKILPGLFRRYASGQMPEEARLIGAARSELDAAGYRAEVRAALHEFADADSLDDETVDGFLGHVNFVTVDATGDSGWAQLRDLLRPGVVRAFYFSVAPSLFGEIAERLMTKGLADEDSRIVVEKPFGRDLASARALNAALATYFDEGQIYRIDHYLG